MSDDAVHPIKDSVLGAFLHTRTAGDSVYSSSATYRFEAKTTIVGHEKEDVHETRVLNRTIRATKDRWELEADQRHAEVIVQMLNLGNAKEVVTPGEHRPWEEEERFGAELLDGPRATEFRGIAARANYLAQDRPDLQFSVKEICRTMSNPSVYDRRKVKRLARYLKGNPRLIYFYNWQEATLNGYSDSDWAGCRRTAKSTSGGALCVGSHLVKSWSASHPEKHHTIVRGGRAGRCREDVLGCSGPRAVSV